ncbi:trk system potassium uptake protein TrkA [Abditibacterium utsteinense]|uniref:Trk system potassium uptake protein TrkA n=1 Tax=Abditibacterium utsteinense TaxID=1960156 RepID=A0A2S8SUV4_9BACT|nr:TrkA family potassium uptake protein [Abditibacterium utsteinense]PQV64570.1 trk system potassium uptake protein TrkA [Abditibacterium utsteinense]
MKIMIVGCGRVGARLAQRLERGGSEVIVVDEDRETFASLGGDFRGATYHGSGLDGPTLKRAGAAKVDALVAVTGGDNRNLMIVQMAKHEFNVPRVMARLKDPIRAAKYREMGIETLCVTTVVEGLLELWAQNGDFPELPGEMSASGDASALLD